MARVSTAHSEHEIVVGVKEIMSYPIEDGEIDFERGDTDEQEIENIWCVTCNEDVSDLYECDGQYVVAIADESVTN